MTCAYAAVDDSIILAYTTLDDGVLLQCACGWEHNLGFRATPAKAVEEANRHRAETAEREILTIVAELYDATDRRTDNDRRVIVDRLIAAEDHRRSHQ